MTRKAFFVLCSRARGELRVLYHPPAYSWQSMGSLTLWASEGFADDRLRASWRYKERWLAGVRKETSGREEAKYNKWLQQWKNQHQST